MLRAASVVLLIAPLVADIAYANGTLGSLSGRRRLSRSCGASCPSGYYDATGGQCYQNACGNGCAGGLYTDGGCWCACQCNSGYPADLQASSGPCLESSPDPPATSDRFVHVDQVMYYEDARAHCRANYNDLASIHSSTENAEVDALCPGRCWIGGSDVAREGTWTWSDGTVWDYENWSGGQPDNWMATNGEDVIEMYPDGTWNDNDDYSQRTFVCSISGTSATTAGCADGAATETLTSFQVSGTMVTSLSGASGRCLDYVKFHYADGGSTIVRAGYGGSDASQDIDPAVEYVSGLVQYEGCDGYLRGGIEFIVKSIATGATTRTVSFAGWDKTASVRAEFNVDWPCRIIGFWTSPGDASEDTGETVSGVLTDCAGVESTVVACGGSRDDDGDEDDDDDSDGSTLVVILCVVIGTLLVGIAILAMMKRRKPEKPPHGRRGPAMVEAATSPTAPPQLASIKAEALGMMSEELPQAAEPVAEALPHGHVSGAEAAMMAEGEPPPQPSGGWGRRFAAWRAVEEPPPPPEAEFEPEC